MKNTFRHNHIIFLYKYIHLCTFHTSRLDIFLWPDESIPSLTSANSPRYQFKSEELMIKDKLFCPCSVHENIQQQQLITCDLLEGHSDLFYISDQFTW